MSARSLYLRLRRTIWHMVLANPLRVAYISRQRQLFLKSAFPIPAQRAIVFFVPGIDAVTGGVMSILSIAEESRRLHAIHGASVFVCTLPGHPPLLRYTRFENSECLLGVDDVWGVLASSSVVMIHVPEVHVPEALRWLEGNRARIPSCAAINVLLQNIDLCPTQEDMKRLASFGSLSCTTAHKAYSTPEFEARLGCPLHHLSAWVSPEGFKRLDVSEKDRLIIYSRDVIAEKSDVLARLQRALPQFAFREIAGLTYQQYKELIARAQFSITFGEGLDGYLVEPVFSGGVGCAVYNDRFFTPDFKALDFIYSSWDDLVSRFPEDVVRCEEEVTYKAVSARQFEHLARIYSKDVYIGNIKRFYEAVFPYCT